MINNKKVRAKKKAKTKINYFSSSIVSKEVENFMTHNVGMYKFDLANKE